MTSTDEAYGAIGLRACYAMPGTDIAYGAARGRGQGPRDSGREGGGGGGRGRGVGGGVLCTLQVCFAIGLRACYAVSGTDLAYAAACSYAMSGTDIANAAIGLRAC
eukprot:3036309-Rhodomonas_salina.1